VKFFEFPCDIITSSELRFDSGIYFSFRTYEFTT
jgi:hypothetical protein